MSVPTPVKTRGITRPARAQDEDLGEGQGIPKVPAPAVNLVESGGGMSAGSQRHWRLDIRGEASETGGKILRF